MHMRWVPPSAVGSAGLIAKQVAVGMELLQVSGQWQAGCIGQAAYGHTGQTSWRACVIV